MIRKKGLQLMLLAILLPITLQAQGLKNVLTSHKDGFLSEAQKVPLTSELKKLQDKFGTQIFYMSDDVEDKFISKGSKTTVYKAGFESSLKDLLEPHEMVFRKIAKNAYVVMEKKQQSKKVNIETVSGTVTDASSGETLPGVNVLVKGTTMGASTNSEGEYELNVTSLQDTLVFSFIGYQSREVPINGRTQINIELQAQAITGEELVVVGYGTQEAENLTGSISSVDAEEGGLQSVSAGNLSNTLAGRAAGVQISKTSGLAGASSDIRIRGSFNEPLYVINGIIRDKAAFDALDADEVESVNFLKDASSTAIYGSSGGNGVVLVTTKSGSPQELALEYRGSYSHSNAIISESQRYTAIEELHFYNDVASYRGQPNPYGPEVFDYFQNINGGEGYQVNDLIWQDPVTQDHSISGSGGSENVQYFLSLGYHSNNGSYKNLDFDRYNFRSDVTANISDYFKVNLNLSGNQRKYHRWYWPYDGAEDFNVPDFYRATFNTTKLYPYYVDEQGNPTNDPNDIPVKTGGGYHRPELVLNNSGYRDIDYKTINGIISFDLDLSQIVDGLETSVRGSYTTDERNMKSFVLHNEWYIFQSASSTNQFKPAPPDFSQKGSHNLSNTYENVQEDVNLGDSYQINWSLDYKKTFGKHDISAMAVYEQSKYNNKFLAGQAGNLLSPTIDQIYNASSDAERRSFDGNEDESARAAWIGRANYVFDNKYIAEFSFRYDGNYRFAPGERWGFFPSGSLGWRLSEENFMQGISWLSNLKLRGSYGTTGSDSGIGPWQWKNSYYKTGGYVFGNSITNGLAPGGVPNPNITWSTITSWDVGLDFGILDDRLTGSVTVWDRTESDILAGRLGSTPTTFGSSLPPVNYAKRSWKGYELDLRWNDMALGEVSYNLYANMGYAIDQWEVYDEPESFTDGTYKNNWRSRIGKPANRVYGYISKGIIRTQEQLDALPEGFTQFGREPVLGALLFKDIRGSNFSEGADGKIDSNDATYLSDDGRPRITFGFGLNADWKGFSVNAHFQGVGDYDRMVRTINGEGVFQVGRPYFGIWTQGNYWTPDNRNAQYPRATGSWMQPEFGGGPSTFWVKNGSYVSLESLKLAYSLPQSLIHKLGIRGVQIYGNGTNLFTISGFDIHHPEQTTMDSYPVMRTFTGGVNIKF